VSTVTPCKGGSHPHGSEFAPHGSLACIVAFLGEANWSRSKVRRLLEISAEQTAGPWTHRSALPFAGQRKRTFTGDRFAPSC
jgi:hypothetical protein